MKSSEDLAGARVNKRVHQVQLSPLEVSLVMARWSRTEAQIWQIWTLPAISMIRVELNLRH